MRKDVRSECPINLSVEVFGDRWTLLVLRDIALLGPRSFGELLHGLDGISSSVLSDRLGKLVAYGLLTRSADPSHRQKVRYGLTEASIDLVPVIAHLSAWEARHLAARR
jgi:DNA-binding HxlR family transcriptional regulator